MSHWTKRIVWKLHEGETCPVPESAKVIYRTSYTDGSGSHVSHIHLPIIAKDINWKSTRGFGQIYKYAVVG